MARVLAVDDDTAGLAIRKLILEQVGHEVVAVSDPAQALAECAAAPPECAIVDMRLPNPEEGLALIRDLRRLCPGLLMIVLCGYCADIEGRAERELVDEVLCKPVRPEQLLRAVDMCSGC